MIASESCFARGVDHCLSSDEDHLTAAQGALHFQRDALRKALRVWYDIIDLILADSRCYRRICCCVENFDLGVVRSTKCGGRALETNFLTITDLTPPQKPTILTTTTMSAKPKSRWADNEEDAALEAQRKREKEEKKRVKAEKQRKAEEAAQLAKQQRELAAGEAEAQSHQRELSSRPAKRRKLSPEREPVALEELPPAKLLRFPAPDWKKCRSVEDYEKLNDIEEGAYGWVSRAKDTVTGKVVALKRLKMDNAQDGVPVTGLREIQTLMDCDHPNIVALREVVVNEDASKIERYALLPFPGGYIIKSSNQTLTLKSQHIPRP